MISSVYLIRVLPIAEYGTLAFLIGISAFLALIFDYGFHLSFVRKIAISKTLDEYSEVISVSIFIKFILVSVFLLPYVAFTLYIDILAENLQISLMFYLVSIGQGILPMWAYQGFQNLKSATLILGVLRISQVVFIILLIDGAEDLILYPAMVGTSMIFASLLMYYDIVTTNKLLLKIKYIKSVKKYFFEATSIFLASISTSAYTLLVTFFLGIFTTTNEVALYAACEKFVHAIRGISLPFIQATYPKISENLLQKNDISVRESLKIIKKYYLPLLIVISLLTLMVALYAESILLFLYGNDYSQGAPILRTMAVLPAIILIGNIAGVQVLLSIGANHIFRNTIVFFAIAMLATLILLNNSISAIKVSLILVVLESSITITFLYFAFIKLSSIFKQQE